MDGHNRESISARGDRNFKNHPIAHLYPFYDWDKPDSFHVDVSCKCYKVNDLDGNLCIPSFCACRLRCECGSEWDTLTFIPNGQAIIYGRTNAIICNLYSFSCSAGENCPSKKSREYSGYGDGLVALYRNIDNRLVILATETFIKLMENIYSSQSTLNEEWKAITRDYELSGFSEIDFIDSVAFNGAFNHVLRYCVQPFLNPNIGVCRNGCNGKVLVIDGIELSIRKKSLTRMKRKYFNDRYALYLFTKFIFSLFTYGSCFLKHVDKRPSSIKRRILSFHFNWTKI